MNLLWIIVVIFLVLALVGTPGVGPWQHGYGWGPSGAFGLVVIVLIVLLLAGRL
jgi:hypothetical protein